MEKITYEDAVKRLEEIVQKLEGGQVSMTDAMQMFEEGRTLVQECYGELDQAKGRLSVIKEQLDKLVEE